MNFAELGLTRVKETPSKVNGLLQEVSSPSIRAFREAQRLMHNERGISGSEIAATIGFIALVVLLPLATCGSYINNR